jgi:hypothetical protein
MQTARVALRPLARRHTAASLRSFATSHPAFSANRRPLTLKDHVVRPPPSRHKTERRLLTAWMPSTLPMRSPPARAAMARPRPSTPTRRSSSASPRPRPWAARAPARTRRSSSPWATRVRTRSCTAPHPSAHVIPARSHPACFLGALQHVAATTGKKDAVKGAKVHAKVLLGHPDSPALEGFGIAVDLTVEGVQDDELIAAAHEVRFSIWAARWRYT